ncbi:hypothetical protein EFW58_01534 [Bacillus velezensis]|nr:hypothetical protein EFW58_01534 [Bacillus velezensis]
MNVEAAGIQNRYDPRFVIPFSFKALKMNLFDHVENNCDIFLQIFLKRLKIY